MVAKETQTMEMAEIRRLIDSAYSWGFYAGKASEPSDDEMRKMYHKMADEAVGACIDALVDLKSALGIKEEE